MQWHTNVHYGTLHKGSNSTENVRKKKNIFIDVIGAPVSQWVKHWPTDLTVSDSSPTPCKFFSNINGVPLHTAFHYHLPFVLMTEMLLKRM